MTDNIKNLQEQSVDLSKLHEQKVAADAAKAVAAQREAERQIVKWDRAMSRAFKGIVPKRQRRALLEKAVDRDAR